MADSHDVDDTGVDETDDSELISRLRVIEGQPLSGRAEAYAALHDEFSQRLDSGPGAHGARP